MQLVNINDLPNEVVFGATGVNEVIQAVRTIVSTRRGTVPLDREFGISHDFLDTPVLGVRARIEQEIFLQIKKYEPRAILRQILWSDDAISGTIWPCLKIEVRI